MTNVIRLEEQTAGNLTWMLPETVSGLIDSLSPMDKKIILEKLTILTRKYVHFMTGAMQSGPLGDQALGLFEQTMNQVAGQMLAALEERKRRGEG